MNRNLQQQLEAWVDGELPRREAGRMDTLVTRDPEARAFVENLREFRRCLREHEPAPVLPESRDFYWSRIRRGIEAETATPKPADPARHRVRWLGWLIPVGAVAAAFVIALLPGGPHPGALQSGPTRSNGPAVEGKAMVGHVVESPVPGMDSLTFYSARDSITVVWVGRVDIL
jgi:anti-sigma factor RsiW